MSSRKQPTRRSERVTACEATLDVLGGSSQSTSIRGFSAVDYSRDLESDESIVISSSSSSCATPPRAKERAPKRKKPTPTGTRKYKKPASEPKKKGDVQRAHPKKADPKSCCHPGCIKRMRGSSGYCRAHGGGPLCSVKNCDKFARLSGRCSFHGGYARCVEVGCEERAYILGRCVQHSSVRKCTFEDCVAKAMHNGFCDKHNDRSKCMHPGCSAPRLTSQGASFCRVHSNAVSSLQRQIVKRREAGDVLEPPQCLHYSMGASKRCRESAVSGSGFCPLHHTLSLCGHGLCSWKAQVDGLCLAHACIVGCEALQCNRPAERTFNGSRYCKEHGSWRAKCHAAGCLRPVYRVGHLCPAHHPAGGAHPRAADPPMDPLSHAEALLLLGGQEGEDDDGMSMASEEEEEEAAAAREAEGRARAQEHGQEGPRPDSRAGNGAAQVGTGRVTVVRESLLVPAHSTHSTHSLGPLDRWDVLSNLGPSLLLPLSSSGSGSFDKHTLLDLMEPGHWEATDDVDRGSI